MIESSTKKQKYRTNTEFYPSPGLRPTSPTRGEVKSRSLAFMILALLAGCNPFMPFRPDSETLVKKGWARNPSCQPDPEPLYCYNSLGQKVCHTAPLDDQRRLNGYYGPRP